MSLSETKLSRDNTDDGKDDAGRLQQYKNLTKHEELRRRRTECSVEIRKQKGADLMMKRRNIIDNEDDDLNECESENEDKDKLSNGNQMSNTNRLSNDEIKQILSSNPSEDDMIRCFESLRKSLSKTKNPPIDDVIQSGLINALVQALRVQNDRVQYEAAWALTNIVSGSTSQTMSAVEAGACAPLIELSCHSDGQIAEQALWAVANIAGDSAQLRDYVIECHGVEALMHIMSRIDQFTTSHVRTIAWAFSNMCRHKNPHAPLPVLKVLAKGLAVLVKHSDRQVRQDACWAVSYLTDGPDEQIELARESGVLSTIVSYLDESENLIAPALRTLGNVATGNDSLTQSVIDLGVLDRMVQLMEKTRSTSIMKECCWLISNIIAGTQKQIQNYDIFEMRRFRTTMFQTFSAFLYSDFCTPNEHCSFQFCVFLRAVQNGGRASAGLEKASAEEKRPRRAPLRKSLARPRPAEAGLANVTTVSKSHILRQVAFFFNFLFFLALFQQITHFSRVFSIFPSICGDMNISNASDDTIQMPQWFIDPNKTDCELVIKNKKEGFGGFYIPIDIVNDAQKLLDDLGKSFEEMRYQAPPQSQPPARHLTFLQRTLGGSSAPKSSSLHQEQQQYERDTRSMPASKFWPLAKSSYPILHEIAQKVHAIQASEADKQKTWGFR
ncbi:Protein CBG24181 [Caenorhabditis briggsae]|uniref:Protein CBG24181 n=1 Tax=Caenorhabditis briggsae TaxID=6238 RepID=A8WK55_CAEBR|nr:Protein CBG24181 [Caenorhabditis briggsae]CAP20848.2 Protein CBG24181 [Caenorhabditis briggsae]